jgi:hypothetical protein
MELSRKARVVFLVVAGSAGSASVDWSNAISDKATKFGMGTTESIEAVKSTGAARELHES